MNNRYEGISGEEYAKNYLIDKGYSILDSNYLGRHGEIDIIASKDGYIVFIEVKSRNNERFGHPLESITRAKVNSIVMTARSYIHSKKLYDRPIRFDVISILRGKIEHIEDAFRAQIRIYKRFM